MGSCKPTQFVSKDLQGEKSLSKLKFSNTIGYHQPDLNTNRKVYALCL